MNLKLISLALSFVALFIAAGIVASYLSGRWRESRLTQQVEPIQAAVESYRQQHGIYPESLSAASIPEPEEIFYQRQPDGTYILWFGMELGESVTFGPTDRKSQ